MNKILYSFLATFLIILVVSGCSTPEQNTTTASTKGTGNNNVNTGIPSTGGSNTTNTGTTGSTKSTYEQLFDYSKTSKFQYRTNTNYGGQRNTIDTDYIVTPDTTEGKQAWKILTVTTTEAGAVKTTMWIDKITHKCLKWESFIENGAAKTEQPGGCPLSGLNSADYGNSEPEKKGQEEVNVPAGIFNADRYELEGITFWTASAVSVPVQIIYNDGTVKMVLMSYSQ